MALTKLVPTEAYVRDAFVSEMLRDAGQPNDGSGAAQRSIGEAQDRWNLWLAAHDAELTEKVRRETLEEAAKVSENAFLFHDILTPGTGPFTRQQHAADEARQQIAAAIRALTPSTERSNTP